ncbi:hypothetical protein [Fictibacillus sp. NRS-1165]
MRDLGKAKFPAEYWEAIINNDSEFDNVFFLGFPAHGFMHSYTSFNNIY